MDLNERRDDIDIIMFTGRRWVLTSVMSIDFLIGIGVNQTDRIRSYLDSSFHGLYASYEVFFFSEAINIDGWVDYAALPLGLV